MKREGTGLRKVTGVGVKKATYANGTVRLLSEREGYQKKEELRVQKFLAGGGGKSRGGK